MIRAKDLNMFFIQLLFVGMCAIANSSIMCSAFAPIYTSKTTPVAALSALSSIRNRPPLNHRETQLHSNSANQAEQYISDQYPRFYYLMQQNPTCLERIRSSSRGFAIFAPSEEAMDALGDSLNLLEFSCSDVDMLPILQAMASYHVVSVPATVDIMKQFGVVSTREGELPVEEHNGSIYVNGVRVVQCFRFEDNVVTNYQDTEGNLLGSETVQGEGSVCLVYEMEGMVCPDELWTALYECYRSKNSETGAM
jgi:hypothetical protein